MLLARSRSLYLLISLACLAVLGAAFYLEFQVGLEPCSLCITQRVLLAAIALVALVVALHSPGRTGWRIYSALALMASLAGALSATRQIWLQSQSPILSQGCHPGLEYVMQVWSRAELWHALVLGTPECARINWTLFGLSLPEWSLLAFAGLALFALSQLIQRAR